MTQALYAHINNKTKIKKKKKDPISKYSTQKKGWWLSQGVGPEFQS
jgi:hypothetical protein